jgi:hypothetical protein
MAKRSSTTLAYLIKVTCDRVEIVGKRANGEEIAELSGS